MRRLVGAGRTQASTGDVRVRDAAEQLVDAVCVGRRERQVVFTCDFLPLA